MPVTLCERTVLTLSGVLWIWVLGALMGCATPHPVIQQGISLESSGQHEQAVALYEEAIRSGSAPGDQVKARLTAARGSLAEVHAAEAQRVLGRGNLPEAIVLAGKAVALAPDLPATQSAVRQVRDRTLDQASALHTRGQAAVSIDLLNKFLAIAPNDADVRRQRDGYAEIFAGLESAARSYDERGLPGNAFLAYGALAQVHPEHREYGQEVDRRRQALLDRYKIPVTWEVTTRGSLGQSIQVSLQSLKLRSPLMKATAGQKTPDSLHLQIFRIDEDFSQRVEPGSGTRAIPNGSRRVPNPEAAEARERLKQLEGEVSSLGEKIDRVHAAAGRATSQADKNRLMAEAARMESQFHQLSTEFASLSERSETLSAEVEVLSYRDVTYPLDRYHRSALLNYQIQATSGRSDLKLKLTLEQSASAETTSEVHPAFLEFGVPAKSLQFPLSDEALLDKAIKDLVEGVAATTDNLLNDVLVLERNAGRELLQGGRADEAAEKFVRVLLCAPSDPTPEMVETFRAKGVEDVQRLKNPSSMPQ